MALAYPEHSFRHAVQPCHMDQLEPIADLPNLELASLEKEGTPVPKRDGSGKMTWKWI